MAQIPASVYLFRCPGYMFPNLSDEFFTDSWRFWVSFALVVAYLVF